MTQIERLRTEAAQRADRCDVFVAVMNRLIVERIEHAKHATQGWVWASQDQMDEYSYALNRYVWLKKKYARGKDVWSQMQQARQRCHALIEQARFCKGDRP